MKEQEYVIFDLDGTLVDAFPTMVHACRQVMSRHGRKADATLSFFEPYRESTPQLLLAAVAEVCDMELALFKEEFDEEYGKLPTDGTTAIPSVLGIMQREREKGMGVIVLTNKRQYIAERVCEDVIGHGVVDYVIGRRDTRPVKPSTEILTRLQEHGIQRERCIWYYGDTGIDRVCAELIGGRYTDIRKEKDDNIINTSKQLSL